MKTPTVEQLQGWTQLWDEAKPYLSYQKVFDQRLQPSQPASDTAEIRQVVDDLVNQVEQEELGQDPTEVEQVVGELVDQVEGQDQQAKNAIKAQVCEVIAGQYIATLNDELGNALENLGLEPPWSTRNRKSGLYRTDEHVIPLAIRLLDGLRLSKASGYIDFAESDHLYGYKSPFADSHLAVNTGLDDKIKKYPKQADQLYQKALARRVEMTEYVDELTSRLLDLNIDIMKTPPERQDDIKNSIHADVSTLMERTEGDTLAGIDAKMIEKTTSLIDRLMNLYFSSVSGELTNEQNVELQTTTRSKIEQIFKQFNQEKNAERRLNDCFDLAFCAKASESDQSAARLQAMVDRIKIFGVLRGASVNSAQWFLLLRIDELERHYKSMSLMRQSIEIVLTYAARHAVEISSYGLLKAALDEMKARNMHFAVDDWIDMTKDALRGCEPSIIKQCLHIKDKSGKSLLKECREEQRNLIDQAVCSDEGRLSMRSNEDRLKILLDARVNVDAKTLNGDTALMAACGSGNIAIVEKLIEAEAEINATDNSGATALMDACAGGHGDIVSQLIQAGADVDAKAAYGQTALIMACRRNNEVVVTQLIEKNADINAKYGRWGVTALMEACMYENESFVSKLLKAGADVNAKDSRGKTAYDYAKKFASDDLANRVIALESVGTRANRIARETGRALGNPAVLTVVTALAVITNTAALYASGKLDTALESASQAIPEAVSAASNITAQALTELTAAATEIGRQMGYGPSL